MSLSQHCVYQPWLAQCLIRLSPHVKCHIFLGSLFTSVGYHLWSVPLTSYPKLRSFKCIPLDLCSLVHQLQPRLTSCTSATKGNETNILELVFMNAERNNASDASASFNNKLVARRMGQQENLSP
jgi:hypothetical protein